ncbi:MAG: CHAT domain-containing tetratricopeptide repeat protein [bacterium]
MRARWAGLLVCAIAAGLPSARPARATVAPVADVLAEAQAALDSTRYAAADSLATLARTRLEAEPHPDPVRLATANLTLARVRLEQRVFADSVALRSAARALELLTPPDPSTDLLRAQAHDTLAGILNEEGHSDRALEHAREALAIRREKLGEASEPVTSSYYRVGNTLKRLGEADSALVALRQGLTLRVRLGLPHDRLIGDFHAEIAALLETQGDWDGARAELETALREYESRLGPDNPAMCQGLSRYGTFEFHCGDVARAIDLDQRAVEIAEASPTYSASNLALLRGNLAVGLIELGDFARGHRLVEKALPVFEERLGPRHRQTRWAQYMLGFTEAAEGDSSGAVDRLRAVCKAIEADSTITDTSVLAQAWAEIAQILQDSNTKEALAIAERVEKIERSRPTPAPYAVVELQCLQLRLQAKLAHWSAVDSLAERLGKDLDTFGLRGAKSEIVALTEQSEAASWRGRRGDAVRIALEGSRLARKNLVDNLRTLPDREGLAMVGQRCEPLDVLVDQASVPDTRDAGTAWDEVIRWRGLVGAEIAERRDPLGSGVDSAAVRAHADWVFAQRRLAQFSVRGAAGSDSAAAAALRDLQSRADDAERRWAAAAPQVAATKGPGDVGLAEVRAALKPDAVLVAFSMVDLREKPTRLFAFAVSGRDRARGAPEAVRSFALGEVEKIADAQEAWQALAGRSPEGDPDAESACRAAGRKLRALTWDVIAPAVAGARDVYLVPEGPLHALTWGALPDGETGYLVERDPRIHILDAERDLVGDQARLSGNGLLAVGGVDFDGVTKSAPAAPLLLASTRAVFTDCASGVPSTFPPLPGTEGEVESIAREWTGARVLRGVDATEAAFKADAPGKLILHLATHGVVLGDSCDAPSPGTRGVGGVAPLDKTGSAAPTAPSASAKGAKPFSPPVVAASSPWLGRRVLLALAGANHARDHDRDENEGLLTAEEVTTLDLRGTDWVVLSACQSGVGQIWSREGYLGMTRAFHLAGARAVIASQWAVDDESTRDWMSALYAARRAGAVTAADAMQRASRAVLKARRAAGQGTHPFYWAAFTASGD